MKRVASVTLCEERGRVEVCETVDGATRGLPWIRFRRGDGPRLVVTSAVHGNEVTGIRALQLFYDELRAKSFHGTVTCLPMLNPSGCESNRREVSETSEDLNRYFPGRSDGGFAERLARAGYQAILGESPDCHVDLHADSSESIAYVILDRYLNAESAQLLPRVESLSAAFEAIRLYDWPLDQYRSNRLDASLSGSVLNQGKVPSFTVELGTLRYADEAKAVLACRGLLGVMARLGMLEPAATGGPEAGAPKVELRRCTPLRAERAGFGRFLVRAGQRVEAGMVICELSDVFRTRVEELKSPVSGVVLSIPDRYWFSPGMGLLTMAVRDE